jgi:hypothetical protein
MPYLYEHAGAGESQQDSGVTELVFAAPLHELQARFRGSA